MKKKEKSAKKSDKIDNPHKKKETSSTIVAILIVLSLIIGVVYLISSASKPKISTDTYKGFDFFQDAYGYWNVELKTALGDSVVPFYYHPSELEDINYDNNINTGLVIVQKNKGEVVIVADTKFANPELSDTQSFTIAYVEIQKITSKVFGMDTSAAFNEEIQGVENMKIFDCSMSNNKTYVFELQLGEPEEENRVYSEGFCGIIRVNKPEDIIMLADLLVYKLLGIME